MAIVMFPLLDVAASPSACTLGWTLGETRYDDSCPENERAGEAAIELCTLAPNGHPIKQWKDCNARAQILRDACHLSDACAEIQKAREACAPPPPLLPDPLKYDFNVFGAARPPALLLLATWALASAWRSGFEMYAHT